MKTNNKLLTRVISFMLSLLMVVTNIGVAPVVAVAAENSQVVGNNVDDDKWSGTTSGLVAENYELNDYEKAILACSGLVGDTYTVDVPQDNSNGLVSVDADAQVITAEVYEANGFVWKPTFAVVAYNTGSSGDAIDVELNEVGGKYVGTFTKPANSYSVNVTYSLYISVDAELQKTLINTPFYLTDGYVKLDDAVNGSLAMAVSAINEKMSDLRALYNGIEYKVEQNNQTVFEYKLGFKDGSACKTAIGALIVDYDKPENNNRLTLAKDFADYTASQSKIKYMLENGKTVKEHIDWFYTQLATINANSQEILDIAIALENLATGTGENTIAAAKAEIDARLPELNAKLDEKIQTDIITPVVNKAKNDYNLDISSLNGKTRANDAIYNEIEAKRVEFNKLADDADKAADFYKIMGNTEKEAEYRANATMIRTEGIAALDSLEDLIREAYTLGDEEIAKAVAEKKAELDAMADTATEKAAQIREIVSGANGGISLRQVVNAVRNYKNQEWQYIGKTLVRDDITDEQYLALDSAVKAAIDPIYGDLLVETHDFEIKSELYATETVISARVDQFAVRVDVKASVVAKTSVDSTDLVPLMVTTTTFPMDKDSAASAVVDAIAASGVEASALSAWDSYYNINTDNYNRVVTVTDKDGKEIDKDRALTSDVTYTIEYTPKTLVIKETYKAAGEDKTEVPYGYNWKLPRPEAESKSYDYEIDGVSHRESTIIRVVKDITVSRKEGKALVEKSLAELIAMSLTPGSQLSDKEKAVLNSGALLVDTIFYRTPDSNDKLTKVTDSGTCYRVEAQSMSAGIVGSNAQWVPVSAYPVYENGNGASFDMVANGNVYEGFFDYGDPIDRVQVVYQLVIDTTDANTVSAFVNLANELTLETKAQKEALDKLCTQNNFYANLGRVNSTVLGTIGSTVKDMTVEAKTALAKLTAECINPNSGNTYLYEYLGAYMDAENGGLPYYYKAENAANIIKQVALVNEYLPIIWNDAPVQKYISSMPDLSAQSSKVEAVMAQLKSTNLIPVNELVNTNSAFINNLLEVVNGDGTAADHGTVAGEITLQQILTSGAPGQSSYAVEIQVLNKNDGVVSTYKKEAFRAQGKVVTVADFEALYTQLFAEVQNANYYVVTKNLPTEDVILDEDGVVYTSQLRPVSYTVKIDGEADQTIYAFDAYTINLPGTGNAGFKYEYSIGSSKVEVGSGTYESFVLATSIDKIDALFGADRELVITRTLIDINKDNFLKFVQNLNKVFANAGVVSGNDLTLAFIPMQDANGNLSVVLRIGNVSAQLDANAFAKEIMGIVQDLSYVGIDNSPLFGLNSDSELKLYVQTIVNMFTNSGLGINTLVDITAEDGSLKEFKVKGATVIGATNNTIEVSDGKVINATDKLGAKLIETTMQYGVNINNATNVPFYVTYQDFGAQKENLAKARKGAAQILPYFNMNCNEGAVNFTLNAPDSVYAYLISAMLVAGEIDFDTIQSYDLKEVVKYWTDLIKPMFEGGEVNSETFINTIEKTGFYGKIANFDTEANKALVDTLYDAMNHLLNNTAIEGSSKDGLYEGVFTYDAIEMLFNKKPALEDYKNMIAEVETGVKLPVNFNLKNRDVNYQALVLDINVEQAIQDPKATLGSLDIKETAKKYYMSRDIVADIPNLTEGAIVVLLSDVRGNITANDNVVINLNGCTINGDITAKGTVSIVDSKLSTKDYGSVTGKLIANGGTFKLGSGKFSTGAEAYLEDCYYIEDSVVTNGCYTIEKNGSDLNVYLGTDYMSLTKSAAKTMATDLVFKLIMNYYASSRLTVDGDTLYTVDLCDITDALDNFSSLLTDGLDCIDCAGCSSFATKFMKDVTDFAAIADAIDNKTAIAEYAIGNSPFEPYMEVEGKGKDSYLSLNIKSSDNVQVTNLNVYVSNEVDADKRAKMSKILRELDSITTFGDIKVDITDIKYNKKTVLGVEGSASASVEIDLTNNVNYPVIIAAIVADSVGGTYKAELVNAIKSYQTSGAVSELKKAIEKLTANQAVTAVKATQNKSFASIMKSLGITAPEAVELESLYTVARKVLAVALNVADVQGGNATLGGIKSSTEFGTYSYKYQRSADTYAQLTLKLFTETRAITVKDKNGIITMNTDDLAAALASVSEGSTVYVNEAVVLENDVTLNSVAFTLQKAENINFNGCKLWFESTDTKLSVNKDITANVTWDEAIFCSKVEYTMDGEMYVFSLVGEQHEWEDVLPVEPTCTEPGSTAGVWCKYCHTYQEGKEPQPVAKYGHDYKETVVPPTCTEEGYTLHTCSRCKDTYTTDRVSATNHAGTTKVLDAVPNTCTEDGLTEGLMCTACGEVIVEQQTVPAAHKPVDGINKDATCTEDGYTNRTECSVCHEVLESGTVIPMKGHTTVVDPAVPATCTESGLSEGAHCSECNEVFVAQQIINPLGHLEEIDPAVPATCEKTGLTEGKHCKRCEVVLVPQVETPLAEHTVVVDPAVPATCEKTGLTEGSHCGVCNKVLVAQVETPLAAHTPVVDPAVPATCTKTGLTEGSHCGVCGKVIVAQVETPLAAHTPVVDQGVGATTTTTGLTEGSHCDVCGKVLVEQKELAKLPYINVPTVTVDADDGIIRGAKVDAQNKRIYLDVNPNGFTAKEFEDVIFKIYNATTSKKTISKIDGTAQRGENDLICTGDKVTVWAANADNAQTSVDYTIIIMGDANCDGKLNARDLVLMKLAFVGDLALEQPGFLAADMNFDGKMNARDTVACETKFVLWAENEYVSQTK